MSTIEKKVFHDDVDRLQTALPTGSDLDQISYHICDFLVTETGIKVLEFGNALKSSTFEGRDFYNRHLHSEQSVRVKIFFHLKTLSD